MKIFVPGRICLFGEHSDWAGGYRRINADIEKGYTLICGTDQGIHAEVAPHPNALVLTSTTPDGHHQGPYEIPMEAKTLMEEAQRGGFWSYIAGVAYQALTLYHVRGLVVNNYQTDLPIKKGLSSSAAICVLAARAFNRTYDLKLTVRGEMELAYQGEITTPSRCGRMDQGCAFGNRPVLMIYDGDRLDTQELRVDRDLHFVVVDLAAQKDTMEILNRLNRCYPMAENSVERGVQELLGPINKRVVNQAVEALQAGASEKLGALMVEAQAFFDRYATPACPEELTSPVLHRVLSYAPLQPHIFGGKGVGSQGDGTAQFLARSAADQQAIMEIIKRDLGMECLELTLRPSQNVRKAVIPAAGFGTRLFPASKATKKELFPIVDRDGIAKPAILLIVEEALDAGIEEIIIIVQEADLDEFESFFRQQVSIENYNKLPRHFQQYAQRLLEIGRHVKFVTQTTQEGFGHAIYCARQAVGNEPFLLMLGDHIYRSTGVKSCAAQLIEAYQQHGISVLGLRRTPENMIANFGTATGVWLEDSQLLNITEFAEKPTADYARTSLRVPDLPEGEYLTVFGQYIIQPKLFEYLEEHIVNNVRERGEFQLTSALDRLRQEECFLGLIMEGKRYDIGLPEYYLETLRTFREDWSQPVMPFKLSAVIFDMDGLMLDSEPLAFAAWRQVLAEEGYTLTEEINRQMLGRTIEDTQAILRQAFNPNLQTEGLAARKRAHVWHHVEQHGVAVKAGLSELLDWLEAHAIAKAVASSAGQQDVMLKLSRSGLASRFEVIVTGDQVTAGKPAPDIFLAAARQLGIPPAECAVLEDSDAGILAAHAAGMLPLMVPDQKPPSPESHDLAHRVFPSLHEAKAFLEQTHSQ